MNGMKKFRNMIDLKRNIFEKSKIIISEEKESFRIIFYNQNPLYSRQ